MFEIAIGDRCHDYRPTRADEAIGVARELSRDFPRECVTLYSAWDGRVLCVYMNGRKVA